jgi:hypothetical protein
MSTIEVGQDLAMLIAYVWVEGYEEPVSRLGSTFKTEFVYVGKTTIRGLKAMMLTVKQGDRPLIESQLVNENSSPTNLTGATVRIKAVNTETNAVEVDDVATVAVPATSGVVRYQTLVGQFDEVGLYRMEWEATFPTGPILTFPSEEFDYVKVTPGL